MSEPTNLKLNAADVRNMVSLLRALKEGLLVNIDDEWEEEEHGERLVDMRSVDRLIRKLEGSLPQQDVDDVRRAVLVRKYHRYHHEVDEMVYSTLSTAFKNRMRIEMEYFSLEREEVTSREIDIYYLSRKYVIALDHLRNAVRKFRTSRIMKAIIKKEGYEIPAVFDKDSYL